MNNPDNLGDQVIIALRRVIRAVDLHSRALVDAYGLTGPQALILKSLQGGSQTAGQLAAHASLSQGTVTDILNRLEQRKLITRERDTADRRRVIVKVSAAGRALMKQSPPLLQEEFVKRFNDLQDWEQSQLISSLQRIATMMGAEDLDAAPVLSSGSILLPAETVEEVPKPQDEI